MRALTLLNSLLLMLIGGSRGFQVASRNSGSKLVQMRSTTPQNSVSATSGEMQAVNGIQDLIGQYDTFLLDMWGVMHDGSNAYEGVLDVVAKLKEEGKDVVILSNSSKRQDNSIRMLKKLGFDPTDFSQIITSGEVAYHMLSRTSPESSPLAPQSWDVLKSVFEAPGKRKAFCFGSGDGDEEYVNSCGWTLSSMDEAELIIARGTFTINDGKSVVHKTHNGEKAYFEAYHEQIEKAAQRRIPMIVANPDKIRPDADRSPMPGTIGNAYEKAMGGDETGLVKYIGKPFPDVYEIAFRKKDRSRACMIGDALETDVAGGSAEGIDTVWVVNDGVHNNEIQSKGDGSLVKGCAVVVEEFNKLEGTYAKGRNLSPTVMMPHFRW